MFLGRSRHGRLAVAAVTVTAAFAPPPPPPITMEPGRNMPPQAYNERIYGACGDLKFDVKLTHVEQKGAFENVTKIVQVRIDQGGSATRVDLRDQLPYKAMRVLSVQPACASSAFILTFGIHELSSESLLAHRVVFTGKQLVSESVIPIKELGKVKLLLLQ